MSAVDLAGRRILIVEDEAIIAMLLEEQLEELGCVAVGPAASVAAALAQLDEEPFEAAVLDVNLRGDWSYPVAQALDERGTPYLFTTGYGQIGLDPQFREKMILAKPFTSDALAQALTKLFNGAGAGRS